MRCVAIIVIGQINSIRYNNGTAILIVDDTEVNLGDVIEIRLIEE